ncbi:hypothetical protein A2U01_0050873, partial [Trifolium medium]|nr:hypothetical protein [Trifolium medium]
MFELWCSVVAAFALQSDGGSLLDEFGFDIRLNLACGAQRSPSCRLLGCASGTDVLVVADATWFSVRAGLIVIVV